MHYLNIDETLILHSFQIEKFGGIDGVKNVGQLESALMRPQTSFLGKDLYENVLEKAAVLAVGIIQNHPFNDGNKRTGIHAMLVFLEINNAKVIFTNKKIVSIGNEIASGRMGVTKLANLLKKNLQK